MSGDGFGAEVSYSDAAAVDVFTQAARDLLGFTPDPVGAVMKLLQDHPDFVMARCLLAGSYLVASDARFQPALASELEELEAREHLANDRERGHIAAARRWLSGDWYGASHAYAEVLARHPRDLLALLFGHQVDFLLGQAGRSQERCATALRHWDRDEPDSGFIHGMLAFGLEECGHYRRAEDTAMHALDLNPRDAWAIHGRAHCFEMQGQTDEGVSFLRERESDWGRPSYLASHNAWHLALLHLERAEIEAALALHDDYMDIGPDTVLMGLHDSCALLWRLTMAGIDVSERWAKVAPRYEEVAEQAYMGFTDIHTAMAFVATDNQRDLERVRGALAEQAGGQGQRAAIVRLSALPIVEGYVAFGRGDYAGAIDLFGAHRHSADLFGGSAAQRDVISWTYLEAAMRAGRGDVVEAVFAERQLLKPESPLTAVLRSRFVALRADSAGFGHGTELQLETF